MSPAVRRRSVRVRILAAVLLATLLGMAVAGVVSHLLARQATFEDIRDAAAVPPGDPVFIRTLSTAEHATLSYISIPVQVQGSDELDHYVAVVDVAVALGPVNRTHLTYAAICVVALGLVALVGYVVAGRLLAPLRSLQRTAQRICEADLTDRIPADQLAANDEVSDLGLTMNAMLDRLADSFDNQRQMLDDAGHELRTPITIVRGHLELVDVVDPADIRATRDLAIDELDRMQRMVEELLAQIKIRIGDPGEATNNLRRHGALSLDLRTRIATVDGTSVELSSREFALLDMFMQHPGQVLSREQLLSRVWGYDFDPGSNVVDVCVRYLRNKLGADRIATVRGAGYRLVS